MRQRSATARLLAAVVIAALPAPWSPVLAEPACAELGGVIHSLDQTPLAGVRLLATDPVVGQVFRSEPTAADGSFTLSDLEPGTYELAVDVGDGLFLVKDSVYLVAGVKRTLRIAVGAESGPDGTFPLPAERVAAPSVWNNPASAALIVLGVAVAVGVLVENATEDELASTQFLND